MSGARPVCDGKLLYAVTGFMTENIYLVEGEEGLVLLDSGAPPSPRIVTRLLRRIGRDPSEISHILLTHFHVDHAGGAAELKRLTGARIWAHESDVPFLQGAEHVPSVYRKGLLGRAALVVPGAAHGATRVAPVSVDRALLDGEVLELLGGLEVMHGPGHTPGSAAYFWPDAGVLFSGDMIINTYRFLTPPTVGFSVDFDQARRSIVSLVDRLESRSVFTVCPGHGPVVDTGAADRLSRLARRMRAGKSD